MTRYERLLLVVTVLVAAGFAVMALLGGHSHLH